MNLAGGSQIPIERPEPWLRIRRSDCEAGATAQPSSASEEANAANYPVTVHVTASCVNWHEGLNTLDATIDSVKYKLVTQGTIQLLALGDYHARLVAPRKTPPAYIASRNYEFLLPEGKTAQFYLCGEWQ
jgi:hypothetical protein